MSPAFGNRIDSYPFTLPATSLTQGGHEHVFSLPLEAIPDCDHDCRCFSAVGEHPGPRGGSRSRASRAALPHRQEDRSYRRRKPGPGYKGGGRPGTMGRIPVLGRFRDSRCGESGSQLGNAKCQRAGGSCRCDRRQRPSDPLLLVPGRPKGFRAHGAGGLEGRGREREDQEGTGQGTAGGMAGSHREAVG